MKRICFALFFLYPVQAVFGGLFQPAVGVAGMGDGMLVTGRTALMWDGSPGLLHAEELGCERFNGPKASPVSEAVAVWAGADGINCIVVVTPEGYRVLGPWEGAGLPCWDGNGNLWFTADGQLMKNAEPTGLPLAAHHISVSPSGRRVVFTDRSDRLLVMSTHTGAVDTLSTSFRYYGPFFAGETAVVSPSLDGGIMLLENGQETRVDHGEHPVWWAERNALVYIRTGDDGHTLISSDLWIWMPGGSRQLTATPTILETAPAPTEGGILYVDAATGLTGFIEVPR